MPVIDVVYGQQEFVGDTQASVFCGCLNWRVTLIYSSCESKYCQSTARKKIKLCCELPGVITPELFVVRNRKYCEMETRCIWRLLHVCVCGRGQYLQRNWCAESPPQRGTVLS